MSGINVAIVGVGVGNCASSFVEGLQHRDGANDNAGLLHAEIGGYRPADIRIVAAWNIDRRKVGRDVASAIFAKPNCTTVSCADIAATGALVAMVRCSTASPTTCATRPRTGPSSSPTLPSPTMTRSSPRCARRGPK